MHTAKRSQRQALAYGLGAVGLWSTVATAFKWSLAYVSPAALVAVAVTASWLLLLLIVTLSGRLGGLRSWSREQLALAGLAGLVNPAAYYWVLFAAYARLPAQEAMAINYTWALALGLLAVPVLGQKLRPRELVAALVSYLGVVWIATRGQLLTLELASPAGIGLALLSTLLWALYWLMGTRHRGDPLLTLLVNFSAALPVVIALAAVQEKVSEWPLQGWLGGLYIGLFEMGVAFVLWLSAMRRAEQTLGIAALIFLSPPLSLLLINRVLGEPILPSTLVGLALILAGLAAHQWLGARSRAAGASTDTDFTNA